LHVVAPTTVEECRSHVCFPSKAASGNHCCQLFDMVHTHQMKLIQVQKKLFEHYQGNTVSETVAAVQDCLQGDNVFAGLCDKANDSSSLTLKNCLSQKEEFSPQAHHSLLTAFHVPIKVPRVN